MSSEKYKNKRGGLVVLAVSVDDLTPEGLNVTVSTDALVHIHGSRGVIDVFVERVKQQLEDTNAKQE